MEDKNYYLTQPIDNSGIAGTMNPAYLNNQYTSNYNPVRFAPMRRNVGDLFESDSQYDENIGSVQDVYEGDTTINDLRAAKQSNFARFGNALLNNLVIAGTTTVGGTIGLVDGIFEALSEGDTSKLWDNATNNWVADVQDATREAFPIYKGKDYEDKSILGKLGTGIFWADLVQNLGFTEGMLIPGMGAARLLQGTPKMLQALGSSLISSIGEGATEAVNERNLELQEKTDTANKRYVELAQQLNMPESIALLDKEYMQTLEDIGSDVTNAGNFVFGSNIALLTMTNAIEFGNLFTRGFNTGKRLNGAIRRQGEQYGVNTAWEMTKAGGSKLGKAFTEGMEEVHQAVISNTPKNYDDYNTFNESVFNPDKRELVGNIWLAIGESYAQTLQDPQTAEEFASGFLIGAIGVPTLNFNRQRSKSPIVVENNAIYDLYNTYQDLQRQSRIADEVNQRLQENDKIKEYYNGLVRHVAIQDDMNQAIEDNDNFTHKNAEFAQFLSDIRMFDNVGDIDRLRDIISNSIDTSDEAINEIIQATSQDNEGPFMNNSNPMNVDQVRSIIETKQRQLLQQIDSYQKAKQKIEQSYPNIDNNTLDNAVYLHRAFEDRAERLNSLSTSTYEAVANLIKELSNDEAITKFASEIKPETLAAAYSNPMFKSLIDLAIDNNQSTIPYTDRQVIRNNLEDIIRLTDSLKSIDEQLKDILNDPSKSARDQQNNEEKAERDYNERKTEDLRQSLSNAASIADLTQIIEDSENNSEAVDIVRELSDNGNQVAKNYLETSEYSSEVTKALKEQGLTEDILNDALKLWNNHRSKAENIDQLGNPNSVYINDDLAFEGTSVDQTQAYNRFIEANYTVKLAMNKANILGKFKDRFSAEFKQPVQKGKVAYTEDSTTGKDNTSASPAVETSTTANKPTPIGDITFDNLIKENKETNNSNTEEVTGNKQYWKPTIPELHIEASKEGNFKPFDEVVREKEGKDYSIIYKYLRDSGAFDYLNSGKLESGDTLGFMIDPAFEEQMKEFSWYKGPTIFIVHEKQIVGSLDTLANSNKFAGLTNLINSIHEEYKSHSGNERFYSKKYTKVSKMMIGKVPTTDTERNLADIPGANDNPILGIIKNGTMVTNDKVPVSDIVMPLNISGKEGRLYLLVPNGAGKYSPMAVRVKHFNSDELDLNSEFKDTILGKSISNTINKLTKVANQSDITPLIDALRKDLYAEEVMISWFDAAAGSGIVLSKNSKDANGNYIETEINGETHIKQEHITVYFNTNQKEITVAGMTYPIDVARELGIDVSNAGQPKSQSDIFNEIVDALYSFNLPIQVRYSSINSVGYNNRLISSNVLTSNLREAKSLGTWFTTDYIDESGKLQPAVNPASKMPDTPTPKPSTPVGGTETIRTGIPVELRYNNSSNRYWVDLTTNTIYGEDNTPMTLPAKTRELLLDLAWVRNNYGNLRNSSRMYEGKVLLPSGKVLDIDKVQYCSAEETKEIKDKLNGTVSEEIRLRREKASSILSQIRADQAKVDKSKTDSDNYYILEEDGEYHSYSRIHSRIGSNSKSEGNFSSDKSLKAGSAVDTIIRNFFNREQVNKPDNMSQKAFESLLVRLAEIRDNLESKGEKFLTNNIVLFMKYPDDTRIAGEVDILAVDKDGNFKIYDVKTGKYSFYEFTNNKGDKVNYFENTAPWQVMSTKDYYTLQLSGYKNLFESMYGEPIQSLAILPFKLTFTEDEVTDVTNERGIPITYNPEVNVPTVYKLSSTQSEAEDNLNETIEAIELLGDDYKWNSVASSQGYFVLDNKVHKSYLTSVGNIAGIEVKAVKIPIISKEGKEPFIAGYDIYVVFPNGNAIKVMSPLTNQAKNETKLLNDINTALNTNTEKVVTEASKETILSKRNKPTNTIDTTDNDISSIRNVDEETENLLDDDELNLREAIESSYTPWNREEELSWLNRVLPQLSEQDRIKFVEGLIRVANKGVEAWGMVSNGIMTLSDIAKEGTVYHEAFHIVFNYILSPVERAGLLEQARKKYGNISLINLEENLAEDFREFIMTEGKDTRSLGTKIIDFFKSLLAKVINWKYFTPSANAYFLAINQGRYVDSSITSRSNTNYSTTEYSKEMQSIKDKAIADGTFMKAPNGNPTNLNERQWLQVRTKNFINWFGDWINNPEEASKVVDENGEPLVVYHGTKNNFTSFDTSYEYVHPDDGYYFSSDITYSKNYGDIILPVFLNIKNPYNSKEEFDSFAVRNMFTDYNIVRHHDGLIGNDKKTDYLVPSKGTEYIAMRSKQIKSATSNNGEFSTTNNDIRFRQLSSEELSQIIDDEFKKAKAIVRELNNRRFNTEQEAINAFKQTGIREDFFAGVIRKGANNAIGHKIKLLTKDEYRRYKELVIEENEEYSKSKQDAEITTLFDSLAPEIQMNLLNKGWTKEQFDSIPQSERNYAIQCAGL